MSFVPSLNVFTVLKYSRIFSPNKRVAHTETPMLDLCEQLHQSCISNNFKIAPEKAFHILLPVKFLGRTWNWQQHN